MSQLQKTLFEKIADREIPAFIIWEDAEHIAFLDIKPLTEGHTLVIPKKNKGSYLFGMDSEEYRKLMEAAKQVAHILEESLGVERVLMVVEGLEIPHVHIKLLPSKQGFSVSEGRGSDVSKDELEKVHKKIKKSNK